MHSVQSPNNWYKDWRTWKLRTSGDHPNYCIIKIVQNTEKSPGDLKRLAVAQSPVKNHLLALAGITLK